MSFVFAWFSSGFGVAPICALSQFPGALAGVVANSGPPPVGLNVYVINGLAKDVPIAATYRGVMPFVISDFIRTALLLAFPALSLWLVRILVP